MVEEYSQNTEKQWGQIAIVLNFTGFPGTFEEFRCFEFAMPSSDWTIKDPACSNTP
jgi:hypothetical protein